MRYIMSCLAIAVITLGSVQSAQGEPKLIAVKFHGDWCGSCKKMGSVFTDLTNKLDGTPVLFVELDRTNNTTSHQSSLLASALGLGDVYQSNPGTGFILLIDGKTREITGKLTAGMGLKQMAAEIETRIGL